MAVVLVGLLALAGCKKKEKVEPNASQVPPTSNEMVPPPAAPGSAAVPPTSGSTAVSGGPAVSGSVVAPAGKGAGSTYTVQKGDTLYKIVRQKYSVEGKALGAKVKEVLAANPQISDPNQIKAGQVLNLP